MEGEGRRRRRTHLSWERRRCTRTHLLRLARCELAQYLDCSNAGPGLKKLGVTTPSPSPARGPIAMHFPGPSGRGRPEKSWCHSAKFEPGLSPDSYAFFRPEPKARRPNLKPGSIYNRHVHGWFGSIFRAWVLIFGPKSKKARQWQ